MLGKTVIMCTLIEPIVSLRSVLIVDQFNYLYSRRVLPCKKIDLHVVVVCVHGWHKVHPRVHSTFEWPNFEYIVHCTAWE
jgi:hypothetical protein